MAAERLKNVAPGASPGLVLALNSAPEGRKTQIFRPFRGSASPRQGDPGLTPGATFLSRSAAGTASSPITSKHQKVQTPGAGLRRGPHTPEPQHPPPYHE